MYHSYYRVRTEIATCLSNKDRIPSHATFRGVKQSLFCPLRGIISAPGGRFMDVYVFKAPGSKYPQIS